jgi:hypothetical protein
MDLVQFSLSPSVSAELKRHAEEYIIARLPQLPLGQRITLARRGPARVAGALIATGHAQVLEIALDNPRLTEAQVLKVLWRDNLPQVVVLTVANHRKWSQHYNVRLALVRNSSTPLAIVLSYLPQLTVVDLRELAAPGIVPENLRKYLLAEAGLETRSRGGASIVARGITFEAEGSGSLRGRIAPPKTKTLPSRTRQTTKTRP